MSSAEKPANLFENVERPAAGERFERLLKCGDVEIERIIGSGDVPPTRYEQAQDEWVALLSGEAELEIDGRTYHLQPGDHLFLPAGTPHTVVSSSREALWLAVHIGLRDPD